VLPASACEHMAANNRQLSAAMRGPVRICRLSYLAPR
jgi:hypothetical protein